MSYDVFDYTTNTKQFLVKYDCARSVFFFFYNKYDNFGGNNRTREKAKTLVRLRVKKKLPRK